MAGNLGTSKAFTPNIPFKEEYLDKSMLERYTYREDGREVLEGRAGHMYFIQMSTKDIDIQYLMAKNL